LGSMFVSHSRIRRRKTQLISIFAVTGSYSENLMIKKR
jgi:hypothetical protein